LYPEIDAQGILTTRGYKIALENNFEIKLPQTT
jgi:hypothetical protein